MTPEQMIEVATDWWVSALGGPKFDNGDRSANGAMATALATISATKPTSAALTKFRAAMVNYLTKHPRVHSLCLDVDYGPGWELSAIANAAGTLGLSFPWKTTMWLDWERGTVSVRYGYGAEVQELTHRG